MSRGKMVEKEVKSEYINNVKNVKTANKRETGKSLGVTTIFLFLMFFCLGVSAQSLSAQETFGVRLTPDQIRQLQSGEAFIDRYDEQPYPLWLPSHPLTAGLKGRFPAHIYGDAFFLFERKGNESEQDYLLKALNKFLAFSEQRGIMYKSSSSGWITLIQDSYSVSGASGIMPVDDTQFKTLPRNAVVYSFQRDHYFSGNRYRYEISYQSNGLKIKMTNETPMKVKGIFKAIDKEQLEMEFYILASGKTVCIYGIAFVEGVENPVNVLGKLVDIPSAMSKRMIALITWFREQE